MYVQAYNLIMQLKNLICFWTSWVIGFMLNKGPGIFTSHLRDTTAVRWYLSFVIFFSFLALIWGKIDNRFKNYFFSFTYQSKSNSEIVP